MITCPGHRRRVYQTPIEETSFVPITSFIGAVQIWHTSKQIITPYTFLMNSLDVVYTHTHIVDKIIIFYHVKKYTYIVVRTKDGVQSFFS